MLRMQIYLILALLFSLLIATFAIQNTAVVTISFLFWERPVSLVLLILGSVAIGALTMFLLGAFKSLGFLRKQKELTSTNNKLNAKIMELEKKLTELEEEQKKEDMGEQEQILVSGEQSEQ